MAATHFFLLSASAEKLWKCNSGCLLLFLWQPGTEHHSEQFRDFLNSSQLSLAGSILTIYPIVLLFFKLSVPLVLPHVAAPPPRRRSRRRFAAVDTFRLAFAWPWTRLWPSYIEFESRLYYSGLRQWQSREFTMSLNNSEARVWNIPVTSINYTVWRLNVSLVF